MNSREQELEKLLELSALLTSTLDLASLLTNILQSAERLMHASASNVMLMDHSTQELIYQVALGQAGSQIKDQKRLKLGVGIAGWVAKNAEPLLIEDAYQDPRFFSDFDKKTGFKTKSIVCIPLSVKGRLIGIAQIINKTDGSVFSNKDLDLFIRFGHIAAVAIDNALLHRQILEQERVKRDMEIAEEIQLASLPATPPRLENLRITYRSIPCRQVGGDVVEVVQVGPDQVAVLIGDVSGKGVPAALFGAKFSTEFKYEIQKTTSPGELFKRLNNVVCDRTTRGIFITAILAVVDAKTGKVQLVNAGHPLPVIAGPGKDQVSTLRTEDFPPLGILPEQDFRATEIQLRPGQHLVLLTDGVTEAKSLDGQRFGDARLISGVKGEPGNLLNRLLKAIRVFGEGELPADDVTLVDLRYGDYLEMEFNSDPANLALVRKNVDQKTKEIGFDEKTQGRISLAVTESLANVMKHTYKMDLGGRIQVGIGRQNNKLEVFIRDWGPKQNPETFVSRDLDDIRPGGLGVHLMKKTMNIVDFDSSLRDGNELYMMVGKEDVKANES